MILILIGLGLAVASAAEPDPRVRPGATFTVDFPELQPDRRGQVSQMQVRIPDGYTPEGVYPLAMWMTGGDGNSSAGGADALVDTTLFVRIGLPFPKGANNPRQGNMVGDFETMWAYHKTMLDTLAELVPNLHPRLRIAAGFSNGAHTIDGELALPHGEFAQAFTAYLLVEGGHTMAAGRVLDDLAGRHIGVFWGTQGGDGRLAAYASAAERAGMRAVGVPMEGVGHAFPGEYKQQAARWIDEVVLPGMLAHELAYCRHLERRDPGAAYRGAKALMAFPQLDEAALAWLRELVAGSEAEAAEALARATRDLSDGTTLTDLRGSQLRRLDRDLVEIATRWAGSPAASEAADLLVEVRARSGE